MPSKPGIFSRTIFPISNSGSVTTLVTRGTVFDASTHKSTSLSTMSSLGVRECKIEPFFKLDNLTRYFRA